MHEISLIPAHGTLDVVLTSNMQTKYRLVLISRSMQEKEENNYSIYIELVCKIEENK
jgi:hypothetical protein